MSEKNFYIIAGCNGAGKTTAASKIFPEMLESFEFVNADEIARELKKTDPGSSDIRAGRVMLERIDELISLGKSFTIETTLASRSMARIVHKAEMRGYRVTLAYIWLNSESLARERVLSRVERGGHSIPDELISRRYYAGVRNLFKIYIPIVDFWMIYDNSGFAPVLIARGSKGTYIIEKFSIFNKLLIQHDDEHGRGEID